MSFFSRPDVAAPDLVVACMGLDGRNETSLKALLPLLRERFGLHCQLSEDPTRADLVFYEAGNRLAQALLRREQAGQGALYVACSAQPDSAEVLPLPFSASRVLGRLQEARSRRSRTPTAGAGERVVQLHQLLDQPDAAGVEIEIGGQLGWLDRSRRQLHWPGEVDADLLAGLISAPLRLRPVSALQLASATARSLTAQSWDRLLWPLAVTSGGATPLPGLVSGRAFRIEDWPDFGTLGRRPVDLRCVALLLRRPLSLDQLVALTGLSPASVLGVLNAAALCRRLQGVSVQPLARSAAGSGPGSIGALLGRVRRVFSMEAA